MHALHTADYIIIAGYMAISLVVGLMMTRKASTNIDHYFLAGRSLPWYLLGVAGMTSWFDLTGTMIVTSFLYMIGPRGLFIEFRGGAVLVLAFLMCYAGKWHRRSGCMTGAEWNTYRFGETKAADAVRVLSAIMGIVATIGMLAYLVRGATLFMGLFFNASPTWTTFGIVALTTVYTMCAGFYGVVLTDLVQGIIIVIACIAVSLIGWNLIPDTMTLQQTAERVTGNPEWLSSVPSWQTPMPAGYEVYESLFMFAFFYLVRNVMGGMASGGEARFFGARNDRECGLQSMLQGFMVMFRWPMMIGFAIMGIFMVSTLFPDMSAVETASARIKETFPDVKPGAWHEKTNYVVHHSEEFPELAADLEALFGPDWSTQLELVGYNGAINPEMILPAVLKYQTPVGLKGFIIVAMLAALMSTFTGTVNGASAFFVKDLYQFLIRPRAANRELIAVSWLSTLGLVAVSFAMGIALKSINDIWSWIIMGLGSGSLAAGMLRLYWWRLNAWGCVGATVLGGFGAVAQRLLLPDMLQWSLLSETTQARLAATLPDWAVQLLHMPSEWQQFIVLTTLSFFGAIGLSLITPPTDERRLIHFYRTTRPFGLWGPVRRKVELELLERMDKENRNDVISVPFALLWQITLFLLPMQLIIKTYDAFLWTLPLHLVAVAGLYWFWWRNLPKADAPVQPA